MSVSVDDAVMDSLSTYPALNALELDFGNRVTYTGFKSISRYAKMKSFLLCKVFSILFFFFLSSSSLSFSRLTSLKKLDMTVLPTFSGDPYLLISKYLTRLETLRFGKATALHAHTASLYSLTTLTCLTHLKMEEVALSDAILSSLVNALSNLEALSISSNENLYDISCVGRLLTRLTSLGM